MSGPFQCGPCGCLHRHQPGRAGARVLRPVRPGPARVVEDRHRPRHGPVLAQLLSRPDRVRRDRLEQDIEAHHRLDSGPRDSRCLPLRFDLVERQTSLALQLQHGPLQHDRADRPHLLGRLVSTPLQF